ncbi:hypothetical protein LOC54_10395 [Acetobacter sp. AN02]|uniref:hypothetical protein n=1 Tax=Acetobacter sp. AN02 TaxID=2894186 RepID=UPI00243443A0|nr:hypothetical protein [Acetobacter sp. AN02]MDG6095506.1 hypothetical protein [Acetobacter sp. AN02]
MFSESEAEVQGSMTFRDHQPADDVHQHHTRELDALRLRVEPFASTNPVILAWAEECIRNLAEDNQTMEEMVRLSASVLLLVLEREIAARISVSQKLPKKWCTVL